MTIPLGNGGSGGPLPGNAAADMALDRTSLERAQRLANQGDRSAEAAEQFESLLIRQLWTTMRSTVGAEVFGAGGMGGSTTLHLLDQSMAEQMSAAGGIGIADMLRENFGGERNDVSRVLDAPGQRAMRGLQSLGPAGQRTIADLGPTTGSALPGLTGRLQVAARDMLNPVSAARWGRTGRLTTDELSSEFSTTRADGREAVFNVRDAAGYEGEYKCNLFAFELVRRAGFETPLMGRRHGWGYPHPDRVTDDASDGRLRQDWGDVISGEGAASLDGGIRRGDRGILLTGSGIEGHRGHMAVVERVHEVHYDQSGEVERVVFDGWEARSTGARHLTRRTWNRYGNPGGSDARNGFSEIEIIGLRPALGRAERPLTRVVGASNLDVERTEITSEMDDYRRDGPTASNPESDPNGGVP